MDASGHTLDKRFAAVDGNYEQYDCLAHIIGIERWGQRRLRVALGEPLITDEYDSYCPSIALFWQDLREEFRTTRANTVALIRQLDDAHIDDSVGIRHNDLGILTVHGWVRYLDMHANEESKKITRIEQ
jgi:hypothetical protein